MILFAYFGSLKGDIKTSTNDKLKWIDTNISEESVSPSKHHRNVGQIIPD